MPWLYPRHMHVVRRRLDHLTADLDGKPSGGHHHERREASALRYAYALLTVALDLNYLPELEAEAFRRGLLPRTNLGVFAARLVRERQEAEGEDAA